MAELTAPQARLLLKLHARPAALAPSYRPLQALIAQDLVRARALGRYGSNHTYECSPAGARRARQMKEAEAMIEEEKPRPEGLS